MPIDTGLAQPFTIDIGDDKTMTLTGNDGSIEQFMWIPVEPFDD